MTPTTDKPSTKLPPSTHEFADIIHRLEAGGSMLPDTPENLMQIIGIYKAYAVPMDFYWRDLLYIAEQESGGEPVAKRREQASGVGLSEHRLPPWLIHERD